MIALSGEGFVFYLPPIIAKIHQTGMEFILKLIVEGKSKPQELKLEGKRITVGRDPGNQIAISETYVSSRHAIFTRNSDDELFVEDCDSANGTFVNNVRIKGEKCFVKAGDRIKFSRLEFEVIGKDTLNGIAVVPLSERKQAGDQITTP